MAETINQEPRTEPSALDAAQGLHDALNAPDLPPQPSTPPAAEPVEPAGTDEPDNQEPAAKPHQLDKGLQGLQQELSAQKAEMKRVIDQNAQLLQVLANQKAGPAPAEVKPTVDVIEAQIAAEHQQIESDLASGKYEESAIPVVRANLAREKLLLAKSKQAEQKADLAMQQVQAGVRQVGEVATFWQRFNMAHPKLIGQREQLEAKYAEKLQARGVDPSAKPDVAKYVWDEIVLDAEVTPEVASKPLSNRPGGPAPSVRTTQPGAAPPGETRQQMIARRSKEQAARVASIETMHEQIAD